MDAPEEENVSETVLKLTTENWGTEVLEAEQPVLVDFWASWCAPCRALAPVIDQVASELAGRVKVGKLNVDEHGPLAAQYEIRSIPTLLVFRDGKIVERRVGALPKGDLVRLLESHQAHGEALNR